MATTAPRSPSPEEILPLWLDELQASDRAKGTIRRYKSAVEGFLAWHEREEQRPLTFAQLSPIALVGYRNEVQRTQGQATSTVNGHMSALRAWCAWLTEERYLEVNPAKRLKLVGRQEASKREGLNDTQVNALLRQARSSRDSLRNSAIFPAVKIGFSLFLVRFILKGLLSCPASFPSVDLSASACASSQRSTSMAARQPS